VDAHAVGATRWRVAPAVPTGGQVTIEPDLSNAAPFLAAAVVTGGRVRVPDWPSVTTQPGPTLLGLLSRFGAVVEQHDQAVTVTGPEQVAGLGEVDLSEVGELTPTVAAMAALAQQPTTITGVAHLRGHETDRLAALTRALRALGGTVQPTPDGLLIVPSRLSGATVASEGDHRMATFAAIVGLAVPGVVVDDVTVTAKTMPSFTALWRDMLT
jgi:3-phosphoshikimate 1-carboxyvinyltransferase